MANPLKSLATANAQAVSRGALYQAIHAFTTAGPTDATANSGYTTCMRFPQVFTNYASVDDSFAYDFNFIIANNGQAIMGAYLEYDLGTHTVSGNSFSAGVSAPTKAINGGSSAVCVFSAVVVYIATALTATNPVLTITYTDQAGNTGNTATLTLPTNATINSCYMVYPHLAAGDTGIRAITGVSISTGSAGSIKIMGLLELAEAVMSTTYGAAQNDIRNTAKPIYPVSASETIAFYQFGLNTASGLYVDWVMVPTT